MLNIQLKMSFCLSLQHQIINMYNVLQFYRISCFHDFCYKDSSFDFINGLLNMKYAAQVCLYYIDIILECHFPIPHIFSLSYTVYYANNLYCQSFK